MDTFKFLTKTLVFAIIISSSLFVYFPPKITLAVDAVSIVGGPGDAAELEMASNMTVGTVANVATSVGVKMIEKNLDITKMIIRAIARAIIRGIIRSTIQWINSGFQGKPGFLQDPQRFLLNIADAELGRLIQGSELNFVCSPFQLNIKKALILSRKQSFGSRTSCTLSGVSNNMNNFISGVNNQFGQYGGWTAWDTMTTQPQNNPYGAYALASAELNIRIQNSQGQQIKLLDWGKGFLSWRNQECVSKADAATIESTANGGGDLLSKPDYSNCKIETPGSLIEDQLALVVGDDVRQLELAQDFNDLVSALIGQMITSAIGLLGSSSSYSSGGVDQSYLGVLGQQDSSTLSNSKNVLINDLNRSISDENNYINANKSILSRINSTESNILGLLSCETGTTSTSTASYSSGGSWALDKLKNILPSMRIQYTNNIASATTNIASLESIKVKANNVSASNYSEIGNVSKELIAIQSSLHMDVHTSQLTNIDGYQTKQSLQAYDTEAQTRLNDCQMSKYGTTGSTVFGF